MSAYLFFLGQTRELCLAELEVVARRLELPAQTLIAETLAQIETSVSLDAKRLQELLGGTSKIAQILDRTPHADEQVVYDKVLDYLLEFRPKRFAIGEHGRDHLPVLDAVQLKRDLVKHGLKSNYKETPRYGGNAGLLKSGSVTEIQVIQLPSEILYVKTLTVQDVDLWSLRDAGKPERDVKRGMLQPKIAHMMINLALGETNPADHVLLDPFCGMGTVLLEGAFMDIPHVVGSDIDSTAIMSTIKNINWWSERQVEPFTFQVLSRPVEKLETHDFEKRPTMIVTEPFLGKLTPEPEQVPRVIDGLERLYKGMMRAFNRVLPVGGRVVIIFPSFRMGKREVTVSKILDNLSEFGFKYVAGPYRGGRPGAVTQREIHVFEKIA